MRMLSIMESVNWVGAEALEEYEWASPLTISLKEEVVLVELDYEIDILLRGTMEITLVHCSTKINSETGR